MEMAFGVLMLVVLILHPVHGATPGWDDAHITFYGNPDGSGTEGGGCGYANTVALGYGYLTAALSNPLYAGGAACGACYEIRCVFLQETPDSKNWCLDPSKTITVTATNSCPPGSQGAWCNPPNKHFDLPEPTFSALANPQGGVAHVEFRSVPCVKTGGIRFTLSGNPSFLTVLIHNVAGAGGVQSVMIKSDSTGYIPMFRNWGANWSVKTGLTGALSFMITGADGRVLETPAAVPAGWAIGQTYQAGQNF